MVIASSAPRIEESQPLALDIRPRLDLSRHKKWARLALISGTIVADLVALELAAMFAAYLRFDIIRTPYSDDLLLLFGAPFFLAAFSLGAYRIEVLRASGRSLGAAVFAVIIATALALAAMFALKAGGNLSRLETGYMVLALACFAGGGRLLVSRIAHHLRHVFVPNSFVLADHDIGADVTDYYDGSINVQRRGWVPRRDDPRFLSELFETVRGADRVVLDFSDPVERARWIEVTRYLGINVESVTPELSAIAPLGIGSWDGSATLVLARGPLQLHERVQKRLFDLIVASGMLIFGSPLLLAIALLIKLESRGPILFIQQRLGRNNQPYFCFKFRTMRGNASDSAGRQSTLRNDPRVTRIGRFLRRTSLDEVPQLLNVVKGDMSLVGPRPHAAASTVGGKLFWEVVENYWHRHSMKPGITGLAQVQGHRGATHAREDIEQRVAADLNYIGNWSLWLDLKILLTTFKVMIHKNAY